jgi:rod shape-determining protein MreC
MSGLETGDFFVAEIMPGRTPGGEPSGFLLRTSSGLRFPAPLGVATPAGLVGVVRTVRGRTGLGEYWTHPDFRVAVVTTDGQDSGIIRPFVTGGGEHLMLLEGIPFQTGLDEGTRLVTSGVGGIYPRGLAVGVVLSEHEAQFGWTHSFLVAPAVRPGTETLVVGWRPGALADSLVARPATDSAGAADSARRGVRP